MTYLLLFGAGLVAGTLNVVAGGGSLLTLPLLIFLGLPATVANGTNRVAILAQNAVAVAGFRRRGHWEGGWLRLAAPPAIAGAVLGTWAAVNIGDLAFQRVLAGVMVGVALWMVWRPFRESAGSAAEPPRGRKERALLVAGFAGVGFYGGFIQAGVGFVILAVTSAAGLDLVRGNALKVLLVLTFTPLALALFWMNGKVDWGMGTALAAGNVLGGLLGVHLTVLKGHAWVRRVVTVMVVLFALKLFFGN